MLIAPSNRWSQMEHVVEANLMCTDSMWIANNDYLYFTENQLWRSPGYWNGTDRRVKPFVLFRVPTADGGHRVSPLKINGTTS